MQRRSHSTELKVKIAVEVLKGQKTMNELASVYSVHPNQISRWKQEALEILTAGFSRRRNRAAKDELELRERLYSQIGQSCTTRRAGSMRKPPIRGHWACRSLVNTLSRFALPFSRALPGCGCIPVSPPHLVPLCLHNTRETKNSTPQNSSSAPTSGGS